MSEMENIATEISYGGGHGGSNESAKVGFRPLVNVTRNSRCQQSSINRVSHQGLDNGISSVHECWTYRINVKKDELTLRTQSSGDRGPATSTQRSKGPSPCSLQKKIFPSTIGVLACVNVVQIEIYLHVTEPASDFP
jgi:hypothetical protein